MNPNQSALIAPLALPEFKLYLIQALLSWCEDEGYTPHIYVKVDDHTVVPKEFVNPDDTIVLSVSVEATHDFRLDRDRMSFQARFGEKARQIEIPLGRIAAFFPKENPDLVSLFPVMETKTSDEPAGDEDDDVPVFTKLT